MIRLPELSDLEQVLTIGGALANVGLHRNLSTRGALDAAVRVARRDFSLPGALFRLNRLNIPDRLAFVGSDKAITWRELDEATNRAAHHFRALGIGPGDRVGIMLPNSATYAEALGAIFKLRAKAVVVGYRLSAREIAHMMTDGACKAFVFLSDYQDRVLAAAKEAGTGPDLLSVGGEVPGAKRWRDALADSFDREPEPDSRRGRGGLIIYTSGTTGKPKGAVRNADKGVLPFAIALLSILPLKAGDIMLTPSPMYHSLAQLFLNIGVALGTTNVLMEHWDAEEALLLMQRHGVHCLSVVPTMLKDLVDLPQEVVDRYPGARPRGFFCSGARLGPDLRQRVVDRFGYCLYDLYGATEYGFAVYAGPDQMREKIEALGVRFPGTEIRLLDLAGREVPTGEVGEVYVRNSMIFQGYHNRPEATSRSERDGFFTVGDMARVEADGYYWIADRKIDMIVSGGANIYSAELETVLHEHPDIDEAAIIGVPDERLGEVVKAYVVPAPGKSLTVEDVQTFCAERIASFKKPRQVEFVKSLPKNPTGKILKRTLRQWHVDGLPADAAV